MERYEILHGMRQSAATSGNGPATVYAEYVQRASDEVREDLSSEASIRRNLRKYVSGVNPPVPRTLQDLYDIPEEFSKTSDGRRFLLHDNGPEAAERVIIFATDEQLKLLAAADSVWADGTFDRAPQGFLQLFTLRIKIDGVYITVGYAFLERKTETCYTHLLDSISSSISDIHNMDMAATDVFVDFELAIHNAFKSSIDPHININGCFMHLCNNVLKRVQTLGHQAEYRAEDEVLRRFVTQVESLAFLPPADLDEGVTVLREQAAEMQEGSCRDAATEILDYFDRTYVTGSYRAVRQPGRQGGLRMVYRRQPPLYPPEKWSVFQRTLDGQDRTNNSSEGWNRAFGELIAHSSPTIWKCIRNLKLDETKVHTQCWACVTAGQPTQAKIHYATATSTQTILYLVPQKLMASRYQNEKRTKI